MKTLRLNQTSEVTGRKKQGHLKEAKTLRKAKGNCEVEWKLSVGLLFTSHILIWAIVYINVLISAALNDLNIVGFFILILQWKQYYNSKLPSSI